jgi:hypothetical protein
MSGLQQRGDRWTVENYLRAKPAEVVALFHSFLDAVQACGPVDIEPTKTGVALHGSKRIFGSVAATKAGLRGFLNVPQRIDDPRFTAIERLTKRLFFHRFLITSSAELDDTFLKWIAEAYAVGQGAHLR